MRSFAASSFTPAILWITLFKATALALLSCDEAGCTGERPICEIGNATMKTIGVANLSTSLDPQPLTWTIGLHEYLDTNSTQPTFDRNFYLGTPPSLQLNSTVGCALFFEGISPNLTAPKGATLSQFTCKDVLAENCISDLISQAQSVTTSSLDATSDEEAFCSSLRDTLANNTPASCKTIDGPWDQVLAQALTGDTAQPEVTDSKCHPTTGKDYQITLVASHKVIAPSRHINEMLPYVQGVTPVMTIFSKDDNETEVDLTCLRIVDSKAGAKSDSNPDKEEGKAVHLGASTTLSLSLAAMLVFLAL